MATGDVWRLAFEGTIQGAQYVNVWHVRFKTEAADIGDAITYIDTNFYQLYKTIVHTTWAVSICKARQLAVPSLLFDQAVSAAGESAANPAMPPQCSMVVTLRTGIAGRSRRGRLYLGGQKTDAFLNGAYTSSTVNAVQTYVDDLVAALGSGGSNADYEWGVWSRVLGGEDPGPYNLTSGFRPITAAVVRNVVHTQRRRVLGVGA